MLTIIYNQMIYCQRFILGSVARTNKEKMIDKQTDNKHKL